MAAYLKQGVGNNIVLEMPFAVGLMQRFTVDIFQHGERVLGYLDEECLVNDTTITIPLTQADTLLLSPQRASLCLRGVYGDGSTVIIEDIPVVMSRSPYRKAVSPE